MSKYLLPLLILGLVDATSASKDRGLYVGGGVSMVSVGVKDPFSNEVNFKTGEVLLGYKYNAYLGAEARIGRSLQDEVLAVNDLETGLRDSVDSRIDQYTSIYYRAELANEIAKIYLLLGQSEVSTTLEFDESGLDDIETTESGFSYGIGFGLWLDEKMNLNFEYKSLVDTEDDAFTGGSITADYRF